MQGSRGETFSAKAIHLPSANPNDGLLQIFPHLMAIKKSELYSSIWASCDELRGGMDASQYKDYVLFLLFIKYISDKYADSDDFAPPVVIPKGASFKDMLDLRGQDGIGCKINTQVIQPLIDSNSRLSRSDFPNFNDRRPRKNVWRNTSFA